MTNAAATEDSNAVEKQIVQTARSVSFGEAFRFWVKLGFISFGGPAGQIAIMHRELVERRRWLGEERFLHALNYCMLLPGPEAQQLAIYIGWLMHRTRGGIVAGAFFVIPSIFILLALSYIYAAYGQVPVVASVLDGFKPVVVAIVIEALLKIGGRALKGRLHLLIAAGAFAAIYFLHVPFPLIVLLAGVAGLAGAKFSPATAAPPENKKDESAARVKSGAETELSLVIEDQFAPPHTLPAHGRTIRILLAAAALWLAPFLMLSAWRGFDNLHIQQYIFFSQSALVTFGGAYAVLAYVTQIVTTEPFNWLTRTQAIDGLALAETTPGPLIMVLQFVGFMAAWNNAPSGMSQLSSAVLGALVTTYATFLPSFIFIFLGAPYIERLRGNKILSDTLSGITAAVVGVILNLALVFGAAVVFPNGFAGGVNWFAAFLSIAAFIALFRFKADVLWVIAAGGLIGLLKTLFLSQ